MSPEPPRKPTYTLEQLLDRCDFNQLVSDEEQEWIDCAPVGEELL